MYSKQVLHSTVCFKAIGSLCDSLILYTADVCKSFRPGGPQVCKDECFICVTREAIGRCPEDSWISLISTAEISPLTFTVHSNSLLCLQASQTDPLFPWRQISFTASNSLLLVGVTYIRSACGDSATEKHRCCVYWNGNSVELCLAPEMSLINIISGFGYVFIFSAYLP